MPVNRLHFSCEGLMTTRVAEEALLKIKGSNGEIKLFNDKVRIKRTGVGGKLLALNNGGKDLLEFPLSSILRIEHEEAGLASEGYIRFITSDGLPHIAGELQKIRTDTNSVTYLKNQEKVFTELREKLLELGSGQISDQGTASSLIKAIPHGRTLTKIIGWVVFGVVLCFTGIGAVFGLPMIILNAVKCFQHKKRIGACPYCGRDLIISHDEINTECQGCDRKLLVRSGMFVHLEEARHYGAELKIRQSRHLQSQIGKGAIIFIAMALIGSALSTSVEK